MKDIQEKIVKKKIDYNDILIIISVVAGAVAIALVTMLIQSLIYYNFIIWFLEVVGAVYLIRRLILIEWEYSVIGSLISVDRIAGKSRRKTLCRIELESCLAWGKVSDLQYMEHISLDEIQKDFECVGRMSDAEDAYFVVFRQDAAVCMLYFEPDKDMVENMMSYARRKLVKAPG